MIRLVDELYDGSGDEYYITQALVRKIARDERKSLPKSGSGDYYGDRFEKIIFRALVEMIASNSGIGVLNCDQGHPAYRVGAEGTAGMGDGPERNPLFEMLREFSSECHEQIYDLSTWDRFCSLVVSGYDTRGAIPAIKDLP